MEEKNLKNEITNLLDGIANMSDADIEEAREILRKAGKNPDAVVAKVMKRLESIQHRRRIGRKQTDSSPVVDKLTYPFLALDSINRKIIISYISTEGLKILSASAVYSIFVTKKGTQEFVPSEIDVNDVTRALAFRKITRELFMLVDFTQGGPLVHFSFTKDHLKPIPLRDIGTVIRTGYLIVDFVWYPIQEENLNIIKDIYSLINDDGTLEIKEALDLYFNRQKFPNVSFLPSSLSLDTISSSELAKTPGKLFVRELYQYQKDGFKWFQHCCLTRTGGILGDDMGLGKTAQAISMIAWAVEQNIFKKFLIVVPGTLLENWRREFEFFAPALKPYTHHGNERTGSVTMIASKDIVLTSYSMAVNDLYLLNKVDWDVILADEASLVKNPDSERRTALKAIGSKVKIAMTGTPVENSLMDLWSLADLTNEGFLGSRSEFTRRFIKRDIETTLIEGDLDSLRNDTSLIMLRRKKEQVLDSLPARINVHQALTMSQPEAELYERQRELILEKANGGAVILGLIQEMRRYTTHPLLAPGSDETEFNVEVLSKSSVKFSRTVQLLDEIKANREKALIFTEYLDMIDIFSNVFEKHYNVPVFTIDGRVPMDERQNNIDLFTAAKGFSIMILNPRTAGMGLNITAANHVIHYTRQWNPALEEQATARAYRNKQAKGVNVYYLYYASTIEEAIDERLRAKSRLSGEVISSIPDELTMDEYLETLKLSPLKNKD